MTIDHQIHLVGFGSQGAAWAQCLRASGWNVQVYLHQKGQSFRRAQEVGFEPRRIEDLPRDLEVAPPVSVGSTHPSPSHWVAMLCPDSTISTIYGDLIAPVSSNVRLILAHGFAVYSGNLKLKRGHEAVLLAPKAIGPKLLQEYLRTRPGAHSLCAAFFAGQEDASFLTRIAEGLGFSPDSLIPATFEQETIGDLLSEQGLLCGTLFSFLEWTMEAMAEAGIPGALIREECLTELELIAGMIREKGPAKTFQAISHAAQCGTISMSEALEASEFKKTFSSQMSKVVKGEFSTYFESQTWKPSAHAFQARLALWEQRLQKNNPQPKRVKESYE